MATKQKLKKVKTVPQKKKLFRATEPLLSVFMWGVNHSINSLSHVNIPVMLLPEDFKASSKIKVDNTAFNKENMPSHFKVKEYCPLVFRHLREKFGIYDEDFVHSLTKAQPVSQDLAGKGGARFLMSTDKRYVVKTLLSEEVEEVHHILQSYHQHIVERHADTLLPQFLALFRFTVNEVDTYMIIMRNTFSPCRTVHKKYDLKGSTVDRTASEKERTKEQPTFKDNDFVNDAATICIGLDSKQKFMGVLQSDVAWLTQQKLMDYSLIVGMHSLEKALQEEALASHDEDDEGNGYLDDSDTEGDLSSSPHQGHHQGHRPGRQMSSGAVPTPPDSPAPVAMGEGGAGEPCLQSEALHPDLDRFAIKSTEEHKTIYYMGLVDILTRYGVKKRTANAAKQVKHGQGAEISSVHPEQYAKRFLDFINKCLS